MWEQDTRDGVYGLDSEEIFWRDLHPFLRERGYRLRPRYIPGWTPSWIGTDINPIHMEDSHGIMVRAERLL